VFAFKKRLEEAHADYAEFLEVDMDDFIQSSKHNTQIARIFRLKAVWPEKYREEVKVLNAEAPIRMLEMLKELGKKELEQQEEQKALESPAIEGEYREVPARMPDPGVKTPPQSAGVGVSPKDRRAAQVQATREARRTHRPQDIRPVRRR
jgi:hypothetical protein